MSNLRKGSSEKLIRRILILEKLRDEFILKYNEMVGAKKYSDGDMQIADSYMEHANRTQELANKLRVKAGMQPIERLDFDSPQADYISKTADALEVDVRLIDRHIASAVEKFLLREEQGNSDRANDIAEADVFWNWVEDVLDDLFMQIRADAQEGKNKENLKLKLYTGITEIFHRDVISISYQEHFGHEGNEGAYQPA